MSNEGVVIPDDYKDPIYRITYWILGHLAPKVPHSISPNLITLAAFFSAMIGTLLLCVVQTPAALLYWIGFNLLWFLLDALDGIHARLSYQTSEFGGFLDHALDLIYFIFMFTAFAVKFDLLHPLYFFIILLRVTAGVMVFLIQNHTKRLYLDAVSGGAELLLFTGAMLATYLWPNFTLEGYLSAAWIDALDLRQGIFMKLTLFVYLIGVPITFAKQFAFVKRELSTPQT